VKTIARLFSIRPDEVSKTLLLYAMHFVFYLGLRWGENASDAMFLEYWSSRDLGTMFILGSTLAFVIGLVYTSYADRINNRKLLLILLAAMIAWLISVRVLLFTNGGPGGFAYPYFYLAYDAINGLATLHILNYINDFYDTRAAKRALPLMLSAGLVASATAGFSGDALESLIGLENIPLAWAVGLVFVIGFVFLTRYFLKNDTSYIRQANRARNSAPAGKNSLDNLKKGFRVVSESGMLRWLALATFLMLFILKLMTFHASTFFEAEFAGNPNERFAFYARMDGLGYSIGLFVQFFLFNRLLSRMGVGGMGLLYPSLTFLSFVSLIYSPTLLASVFGRFNVGIFKRSIRNPLDAMLYNGLPVHIKGRAKGFINAVLVALGTLVAGLLLYGLKQEWFAIQSVNFLGFLAVLLFVFSAFKIRENYTRSLTELLKGENILSLEKDVLETDPQAIQTLYKQISASRDDKMTVFLAEMVHDLQGAKALPFLLNLARDANPLVRANLIQLLSVDWIGDEHVYQLCLKGIYDDDASVRLASANAIARRPNVEKEDLALNTFLARLNDSEIGVCAAVIPPLISSGDFHYLAPAVQQLSTWLNCSEDASLRKLGLQVLAKVNNERLIQTLVRYLNDEDASVRACAVELIDDISAQAASQEVKALGMDILQGLLTDRDPLVRQTAVAGLSHFSSLASNKLVLRAFADETFAVRRQACQLSGPLPKNDLLAMRASSNPFEVECAFYVLSAARHEPTQRRFPLLLVELLKKSYQLRSFEFSLTGSASPGEVLLRDALKEQSNQLLDHFFWLLNSLCSEDDLWAIRSTLQNHDPSIRANALETLESLTSPQVARLIGPLFDDRSLEDIVSLGVNKFDIATCDGPTEVYRHLWPQLGDAKQDSLLDVFDPATRELLMVLTIHTIIEQTTALIPNDLPKSAILIALLKTEQGHSPLAAEILEYAKSRLHINPDMVPMEKTMLTTIEKIIFLKEVQFFHEVTIEQLRILATICEEKHVEQGETIFAEGEPEDALYVVVSGKVALQRKMNRRISRLALFESRQYFAEMSIFDAKAHDADAIAVEPSVLLLIRQAPLAALVERYPQLALNLLKVLSQRLRAANQAVAEKTESKPDALVNIFDKLS
jgi:hypothetical protein